MDIKITFNTDTHNRDAYDAQQAEEEMKEFLVKVYVPDIIHRFCVKILLFYRRARYGYSFRRIHLTQGQFAIVDNADFDELVRYKWFAKKIGRTFYAERNERIHGGVQRKQTVCMHRQVLGMPAGKVVDHINHNGLDNRRANLRIVTRAQNSWHNRKYRGDFTSQYKGVSWENGRGRWRAKIAYNRRNVFIGYFDDEVSAARAYDAKAKELFGEYAILNIDKAPVTDTRD